MMPTQQPRSGLDLREDLPVATSPADVGERSLGELFGDLSRDVSGLVKAQMDLAVVEIREEVRHAARGGGMLGGAGIAALFGVLFLSLAFAIWLSTQIEPWAAFLIVGVVYALVAGALFLLGKNELKEAGPPEHTVESLKEDAQWLKQQKS